MRNQLGKVRPVSRPRTGAMGRPFPPPQRPMNVDVQPAGDRVRWTIGFGDGGSLKALLTAAEARAMAALFLSAAEAIDPTPEAPDADDGDEIPEGLTPEQEELLADAMARAKDFPHS